MASRKISKYALKTKLVGSKLVFEDQVFAESSNFHDHLYLFKSSCLKK